MVWTLIEPGVAIVAASLATIRPLLRVMRLKGFETTRSGKSTNMQSGISNRSRHVPLDDFESQVGGKHFDHVEMNPVQSANGDFGSRPSQGRHYPPSHSRTDRFGQADPIHAPGLAVTTGEDARASFAPSEMYVIEGERTQWRRGDSSRGSATPYSNDAASTSLSSVDIIGMNPASRHGPLGHSINNR